MRAEKPNYHNKYRWEMEIPKFVFILKSIRWPNSIEFFSFRSIWCWYFHWINRCLHRCGTRMTYLLSSCGNFSFRSAINNRWIQFHQTQNEFRMARLTQFIDCFNFIYGNFCFRFTLYWFIKLTYCVCIYMCLPHQLNETEQNKWKIDVHLQSSV